jgi:DNA repair exonuclease SbcCD ATPase subunit
LTAKLKASRSRVASTMLKGVVYKQCPCCATMLDGARFASSEQCGLCGTPTAAQPDNSLEYEALQRDLNQRMDELGESIERHRAAFRRNERRYAEMLALKASKDRELSDEMKSYDSAQLAALRGADRRVAALEERIVHLQRLAAMPAAIDNLERSAGALQGEIDRLRTEMRAERGRMSNADRNIAAIADEFLEILLRVKYPGVGSSDSVVLDTRTWMPEVVHRPDAEIRWSFLDAGSGGKKTLFNVCYALALHRVALARDLPMPRFLIVDSPTKNLGKDINKEIVARMIQEIYSTVVSGKGAFQVLLIDSDYIPPDPNLDLEVADRLMVPGNSEHPPLISFYQGP